MNEGRVYIRDWFALEDDIKHCAAIHNEEEGHHAPLRPNISFPILRNSDKHQGNGQFYWDNGSTVEDLKKKEVHQPFGLVLFISWEVQVLFVDTHAIESCENARYG